MRCEMQVASIKITSTAGVRFQNVPDFCLPLRESSPVIVKFDVSLGENGHVEFWLAAGGRLRRCGSRSFSGLFK